MSRLVQTHEMCLFSPQVQHKAPWGSEMLISSAPEHCWCLAWLKFPWHWSFYSRGHAANAHILKLLTPACVTSESKPEGSSEAREPDLSGMCLLFSHSPIINDSSQERRRSIWGKVREIQTTSPSSWKRTAPPKPASKYLVSWPHLCAAHRPEALKSSPCQNMR